MSLSIPRPRSGVAGMFSRRLPLAVLLVVAACPPVPAAEPADLDRFVERVREEYATPGVALAVVKDDKVLVQRGYGVRRYGGSEAVDEDTLFQIASCTKSFTAAALATQVDDGKLSWDDPVIDHLPEFTLHDLYATRMVTPRDLLAHRSGLPAFTGDLLERFGYSREEILHRMRYLRPGGGLRERANYSNPGYLAAGMLAARVGRTSWDDLVQQRLFRPLGMTHSGTSSRDRTGCDNVAEAHFPAAGGQARVIPWENHDTMGPAGGITSTAADMARWVRMLLNDGKLDGKQVLSPGAVREMFKPAMVSAPTFAEMAPVDEHCGFSFTMGWDRYDYQGCEVIEKAGARAGMRAVVTLVPEKKFGVVVLANMNLTVAPEAIRAYLLEAHVARARGDVQGKIREAARSLHEILTPAPVTVGKGAPPSLPLEKYTGTYENRLYGKLGVKLAEGQLRWEAGPAHYGGPLPHVSYDTFQLQHPDGLIALPEPVTFTIDPKGVPRTLQCDSLGVMTYVAP
jgi:CubicO group peptidase (beta-lactamase class C family)